MKPCFAAVPTVGQSVSPVKDWLTRFQRTSISFSSQHHMALARLLPLLVCGEQSSQWVFYNESRRLQQNPQAVIDFEQIVADEQYHEQALEFVRTQLDEPDDITTLKRRSQHFFAQLAVTESFSEHFAQIACLDSLVCKLMLAIENGSLGKTHPFSLLCRAIKKDEAKHVSMSKRHALELGFCTSHWPQFRQDITQRLYDLLVTEEQAFSDIGVDLKMIFKRGSSAKLSEQVNLAHPVFVTSEVL
ncbi:hypothetical protein M9194_04700 [Vibrio sp. S4M6]|uniref:hypothetical protein n=1 Tax=Vibrio sinus TaxID=2946865 RepID=UPI002029D249|nr:hypothetical protein [Vibrio sinus]MCL9780736.1 hypothetical protein [Vibrio sinus]